MEYIRESKHSMKCQGKKTSQKWLLTKDHFLVNLMGTKLSCWELI